MFLTQDRSNVRAPVRALRVREAIDGTRETLPRRLFVSNSSGLTALIKQQALGLLFGVPDQT
jgi:hypothetical protein